MIYACIAPAADFHASSPANNARLANISMRLIDTTSLTLTEHPDSRLPDYAILSHRWLTTEEEVTFEDLSSGRDVSHKAGFTKLANFCSIAHSQGYQYAWSDTCCIDKASAVELGSALNSMYRWYKTAKICIAYLRDIYDGGAELQNDEWFDRGWTLQELIAPKHIEFFDRGWKSLGTKDSNLDVLSTKTRIPVPVLKDNSMLSSCSIAQRMSWAAHRTTERIEDRAYSLLGMFNINLELIYGEQDGAFIRLQEKIIQYSADQSIFAWSMNSEKGENQVSGMFAPSPSAFAECGDILKGNESTAFSLTNLGLTISLPTVPYDIETYLALLDCSRKGSQPSACGIIVAKLHKDGQWARVSHNGESVLYRARELQKKIGAVTREICVQQNPTSIPMRADRMYGFWLRELRPPYYGSSRVRVISRAASSVGDRVSMDPSMFGTAGIISMESAEVSVGKWSRVRWIKLGFDDEFTPVLMLANISSHAVSAQFQEDFDEAELLGPESLAHSRLFDNDWLRKPGLQKAQREPSIENGWAGGYTIIKLKDSSSGQKYTFRALNLAIGFSLLPDYGPGQDCNLSRTLWTVDITALPPAGQSPEWERRREQCGAWTMIAIGLPLILVGCGVPLVKEGRRRQREMKPA